MLKFIWLMLFPCALSAQWLTWNWGDQDQWPVVNYYEVRYAVPDSTYLLGTVCIQGQTGDPYYPNGVVSTGLTYSRYDSVLYGSSFSVTLGRIELFSKSGVEMDSIDITETCDDMQGLALADTIIFVHGISNSTGGGWYIWKLDLTGNVIDSLAVGSLYSTMDYDYRNNLLWVRNNDRIIMFDPDTWARVDSINIYNGEGVAIDYQENRFWWLYNDKIYKCKRNGATGFTILSTYLNPSNFAAVDHDTTTVAVEYTGNGTLVLTDASTWGVNQSQYAVAIEQTPPDTFIFTRSENTLTVVSGLSAESLAVGDSIAWIGKPAEIEGLVFDQTDRTLWFTSDQYIHGYIPSGNRVWHVNPEYKYNYRLMFPWTIPWSYGHCDSVRIYVDGICLQKGTSHGTYLSPIIDFGTYSPTDSIKSFGNVSIYYRGSDTAPTGTAKTYTNFYIWAEDGDGWGDTEPGAWQETIPSNRYVQTKFMLKRQL